VVPPYMKKENTIRLAGAFGLSAWPNPFNASVFLVSRGLKPAADDKAALRIFNTAGKCVASFKPDRTIEWNAPGLGSGVYFAVLSAGMKKSITKIILMR